MLTTMDAPNHLSRNAAAKLLLSRRGLVFLPSPRGGATTQQVGATLLEFAALGYAGSSRLQTALLALSTDQLAHVREQGIAVLAVKLGANHAHTPLFRRFPRGIPRDTEALWWKRVLTHYVQAADQPCLFCQRDGTTHVLRPCQHVICDHCYDGSNYSACPVCNRHVDRSSPFFQPSEVREAPNERVKFERLDLGGDIDAAARELFESFCARTQALNPVDKTDFLALLDDYAAEALAWLPEKIPLKENVALILGQLFKRCPTAVVLPVARERLRTATDVLRFIAVYSGADAALQGATVYTYKEMRYADTPWWANWVQNAPPQVLAMYVDKTYQAAIPRQVERFPIAKMSRALRRALLSILDGFDETSLTEDMLRHRSYWVWVGEFLHPGEYAKRYPKVARAFAFVRKKDPDGLAAGHFRGFYAQVELAAARGDSSAMAEILLQRPGELGRRFDHLLRVAGSALDGERAVAEAVAAFASKIESYSLPVLLTLYAMLPTRARRAKRRMFWPKGEVANGVSTSDKRPVIPPAIIEAAHGPIEAELLRRFAAHPTFETAIVDEALSSIIAPFNERTASPAAVNLPRGSTVFVPPGKVLRMFLHWCEPQQGMTTDIDLSIGFYNAAWEHVGVCSYYQLEFRIDHEKIATSSGDLTSAPYPDGASEFIDLYREAALGKGIRYAVMVVNAYGGEPFSRLERGFAGLMLRDDTGGHHFDPRTVELKFALQGDHGIYTPLCLDLETNTMHWLDVYSKGELAMNNVANSNKSITRVCPETIDYFQSRIRIDMRTLGLLHAAARCSRVFVREDAGAFVYARGADESSAGFLARMLTGEGAVLRDELPDDVLAVDGTPILALLHRGDLEIPAGSSVYALFREQLSPNLAAADLIK
jgi:hypothetical protein